MDLVSSAAGRVCNPFRHARRRFARSRRTCKTTTSHAFRSVLNRQNSWKSLYSGVGYAQSLTSGFKWYGYRFLDSYRTKLFWGHLEDMPRRMINGVVSGIVVSFATHPIDYARIHSQMQSNEAKRFWYRGFSKTLLKTTAGGLTYFPIYDHLHETLQISPLPAAMATSVLSVTICAPADYLKQRHVYGKMDLPSKINRYWTGWSLNLARVAPHFTIFMVVNDAIRTFFKE